MAEELSQPTPATAPVDSSQAAPATPPVAASSAADPPNPPTPSPTVAAPEDATTRGRGADLAAYNQELEDYLAGRTKAPDPPAPPKEPDPATAGPEPIAPPAAEPAPTPPDVQTPAAKTDDDDLTLPADGSLPKNIKLKVQNAFDFEVMTLRKRGYDWADAQDMAAKRYPESPEAKALASRQPNGHAPGGQKPEDGNQPPTAPQTLADLDTALEAADKAYNAAVLNYDEAGMNAARAEQRKLTAQRSDLAEQAKHQAAQSQDAFNAEFNDYLGQAETLYPAAKDPQSPLSQRAAAIQAQLGRDGSPLYSLPESALIVFQRAAKELGVQPALAQPAPASPPPPSQPAAPQPTQAATPAPQPAPRPRNPGAALLAGGNARTQQPGPAPEVDFSKMSRKQYDAYMEQYLQTSAA